MPVTFGSLNIGDKFRGSNGYSYIKFRDGPDLSTKSAVLYGDSVYAGTLAYFPDNHEVTPITDQTVPLTQAKVHYQLLRPGTKVKQDDGDVLILLPDHVYDEYDEPIHAVSLTTGRVWNLEDEPEVTPCD